MTKIQFWQERVRPAAEKCYLDEETYRLQYKCWRGLVLNQKDQELYDKKREEYRDLFLPYKIQEMVISVEKWLKAKGDFGTSLESIQEVLSTLRRPMYFDLHFGETRSGEHCQNLLELREVLIEFWAKK